MSEEKKTPKFGASRTVYFPMIGFVVLVAMLWEAVSGYMAGGEDAPTMAQLIVSVVLFGGGAIFTAVQTYRTYKAEYREFEKKQSAAAQEEETPAIAEENVPVMEEAE